MVMEMMYVSWLGFVAGAQEAKGARGEAGAGEGKERQGARQGRPRQDKGQTGTGEASLDAPLRHLSLCAT